MNAPELRKLAALEQNHWWYKERRAVLARLLNKLGAPGDALDIGAACGGNTQGLRDHGWKAVALDFSATGPSICRQRGIPALRAAATCLPRERCSMAPVVAFDMLAHVEHDVNVVREVHRVLRPGGQFLVAVPADPELWSAHDVAVLHRRRYTPAGLQEIISSNQFAISRMWSWNVLMRPALKMRRHRLSGSDLNSVPPALNAILSSIIKLERRLPLTRLPGVSLFVQAEALPSVEPPLSASVTPDVRSNITELVTHQDLDLTTPLRQPAYSKAGPAKVEAAVR